MAFMEVQFYSEVLHMEMAAYVLMPQPKDPDASGESYKTLWLYHGGSGDHTGWLRESRIEAYARERNIAVIMPGVHKSCFINMNIGMRYGDFVGRELVEIMRGFFPRLSRRREDNFVSGLSNGGYGCIHVGLSNPDIYGAIGAFSAGDKADSDFTNRQREKEILFGDIDLHQSPYCLKYVGKKLMESGQTPPVVYHACGAKDPWLAQNNLMRDFFTSFPGDPFHYHYDLLEGYGHQWEFWDLEIQKFLDYMGVTAKER